MSIYILNAYIHLYTTNVYIHHSHLILRDIRRYYLVDQQQEIIQFTYFKHLK